jgi:curved DNA-binding protein
MPDEQPFIDYYGILQVDPKCDAKVLETAYRYLAKLYHPDHPETADVNRFNEVMQAYRALRDPEARAEYDALYAVHFKFDPFRHSSAADVEIDEKSVVDDAQLQARILLFLYKRRREQPQSAGIAGFYVQQMLKCTEEEIDFHIWYLKAKGFIEITEQGTLAITIEGIDHVISMARTTVTEKLLLEQSSRPRDGSG